MSQVEKFTPGSFCWTDLGTTDVAGAKKFYGELLGWSFKDMPAGEMGVYTMCNVRDMPVAAMYPQQADQKQQGIPPNWLTYVTVENADASAKKVVELGGKLPAGPAFDVMDAGRMAMVCDPTGAFMALWQPKRHQGARFVGEDQTMCWNELSTGDTAAAEKFYAGLFGWTTKVGADPMQYIHINLGDKSIGGMMKSQMPNVPPHWLVYFAVADVAGAVNKVTSMHGKVIVPKVEIPGTGTFSVVQDPQGAVFAVYKGTH